MHFCTFLGQGFPFGNFSFVHHIRHIITGDRTVSGNDGNFDVVNLFKLSFFGLGRTGHAR